MKTKFSNRYPRFYKTAVDVYRIADKSGDAQYWSLRLKDWRIALINSMEFYLVDRGAKRITWAQARRIIKRMK